MIGKLKNKLALWRINKKFVKEQSELEFSGFISRSKNFVFIMPENIELFEEAVDLVRYFQIHKKKCTIFLLETSQSRMNLENAEIIAYNKLEVSFLGLPGKSLNERIGSVKFDVLINLNFHSDIFLAGLCGMIKAKYKIGFDDDKLTECYNFRVKTGEINSEISYGNLLNSLRMF